MSPTKPDTSNHYIHDQPESLPSRLTKIILSITGIKKQVEQSMTTGEIDQSPAPIPKSLSANYQIKRCEVMDRSIWSIQPKHQASDQTVLFLHGGAYIYSIQNPHWQLLEKLLSKTGATFIVPDFPLAPQAQCPDVYAFVDALYEQLLATTSAENIILMGDSAGGGLALGFTQWLRNESKPLPQQVILFSPWLDITMSNPDMLPLEKKDKVLAVRGLQIAGEAYAGRLDPKDYRVSPIYGDLQGLPPISLFIGTHDLFLADSRKLKALMQSASQPFNYFEYPKMIHVWLVIVHLKESKHALEQISKLILPSAAAYK